MNQDGSLRQNTLRAAAWILFGLTVAAVVFARIRLIDLALERDEGEYAYTGQLLLHGIPPYKLAYSMKFPGTSVAYALLMSIFGTSTRGIRVGLVLINLATTGLLLILGRKLLGEIGGIVTASAYAVLSIMPHVLGLEAHATHFVVIFAVAGTLLLTRAINRESKPLIFASGCLFGCAVLMKQPGFFFVLCGSLCLFARDWRAKLELKEAIARNGALLVGASGPFLITCIALWKCGVFERFWFWTVQYAAQYGSQVAIAEGFRILAGHFWGVLGTAWPIWLLAAVGLIACLTNPSVRTHAGLLLTSAFFSTLAVCPGFYFRPHYFILLLPAVSVLAGTTVAAALDALRTRGPKLRMAVIAIFAACLAWPLWSEADFFFREPLAHANRMINGTNPFPESIKIGEYIRAESKPSDTIAVLGSEPQIYFYAQRRSATGYIYTYGLMEPQPYAHRMQQEMIREIETARPKFLILVVMSKSWLAGKDSDQTIFRWADTYCDSNYEEVGIINISDGDADYYLSGPPVNVIPTAEHILIYRRKA